MLSTGREVGRLRIEYVFGLFLDGGLENFLGKMVGVLATGLGVPAGLRGKGWLPRSGAGKELLWIVTLGSRARMGKLEKFNLTII
jgi:hypothetical protein